jgi:hypothetical protein
VESVIRTGDPTHVATPDQLDRVKYRLNALNTSQIFRARRTR